MTGAPRRRVGAWLTALYPRDFRREFGVDMAQVLGDQLRDASPIGRIAVFGRALADVARTAPREHWEAARAPVAAVTASAGVPSGGAEQLVRRTQGPTRREFLRASLAVAGVGLGASAGGASLALLWPNLGKGFGALVDVGPVAEVTASVMASGGTWAAPQARAYLVGYDPADDPEGEYAALTAGAPFMALYQRCVHLGCRVPWCTSSTRFECPCHQSRYNRWGEYQGGPAPRGLDRFALTISRGRVIVDTRTIVTGPPRAGGVLDEPASGPSCLGG